MWPELLQKHHFVKTTGKVDPFMIPPREKHEIKKSRVVTPPTPPPRHARESQFTLQTRKERQTTIRKSFALFLQLVLFLQLTTLLPFLTSSISFKLNWSENTSDTFLNWNTTSVCQDVTVETTTIYNWDVIKPLVDRIANALVGFLLMILFATMLTLLYIRSNNIFLIILITGTWIIIAFTMGPSWIWNILWSNFGADDALWTTISFEIPTTLPPVTIYSEEVV